MSEPRPRILFLTSSWPLGGNFGGQIRSLNLARALQQVGDVTVSVVGSAADDAEARRLTEKEFAVGHAMPGIPTPNRSIAAKLRRAFDSRYLNVHGCTLSADDRRRLLDAIPQFDLIWLLNSRTANIAGIWKWPHAHLDIDDVPSTYARSARQASRSLLERMKLRLEEAMLRRREARFLERFTTLSVCSEADRRYLGGDARIHVIPNGFEDPHGRLDAPVRPSEELFRIGFIGLHSYAPNRRGVEWFCAQVWPDIKKAFPQARLRLVGRGSEQLAVSDARDIDRLGFVADASAEIATWSLMIVPVREGGGTRIKIAEGFARKCPVVATPLGAFGYEVADRVHLRLAESAREFAFACNDLLADPGEAKRMAERAYGAFREKWTWEAIRPRIVEAAEDCLRRSAEKCG